MKRRIAAWGFLCCSCTSLVGCAIGYNATLFMTKSNVGVDLDTKPPTAEVSIARRELVIAPSFEGGKTPPVLASFRTNIKGLLGVFANVSSTFAGGDAATTMATFFNDPYVRKPTPSDSPITSDLCLTKAPDPISVLGISIELPHAGEVRPFLFGTDTSLGLKLAWSGVTAQFPDTVKIGYNRKEFALAPVFLSPEATTECPLSKQIVKMPSFLATVDSSTTAKSSQESGVDHLQYFATGLAATNLALRYEIRAVMLKRIDPAAADRFQSFRTAQTSQIEAVAKIRAAYDKKLNAGKTAIREKASILKLTSELTTTDKDFRDRIGWIIDGNDPSVTQRLNDLLVFVDTTN